MAKDPALLWYFSDWHSGTSLMSRFLKGCYMDVLHAQFNHGRLSLEEIKTCLGSDFGQSWPALQKKFKQDENGLFFNERLEQEKIKRIDFCESRRRSRINVRQSYVNHTSPHTENRNENRNTDVIKNENKWVQGDFSKPDVQGDELTYPVNSLAFMTAWAKWKQYRKTAHGKDYRKMYAEQAALDQLKGLTEEQIISAINQAISSNWFNLYPFSAGRPAIDGKPIKKQKSFEL